MVTDFQNEDYSQFLSYFPLILSDIEDEMIAFINNQLDDLKYNKSRDEVKDQMAMCVYNSLHSISGDPELDYLTFAQIANLIHSFNKLTNSTVTINFR